MAVKFNPFSGQLQIDEKGSGGGGGGGGASYIDGEVATYNDLPLDGTAPLNSAWLVRTASGVWPVSRKQAGIYIRTATDGVSRDDDWTYAGTMPDVFSDDQFLIYDNADATKNLQFQLSGLTTGTTRTLTVPDASGTLALTNDIPANVTDLTAGNHKIFYSNGDGEIVELALGDSGKVLTSNGATAAPSFEAASGGGGGGSSEVRSDFVSPYTYIGLANAGTAENAASWYIRRSEFDANGSYISTTTATAVEWDDRLIASYS